jgi:hypothetical protein
MVHAAELVIDGGTLSHILGTPAEQALAKVGAQVSYYPNMIIMIIIIICNISSSCRDPESKESIPKECLGPKLRGSMLSE